MNSKLILSLALVLGGSLLGCSTTSNRSVETFPTAQFQNHAKKIFHNIEQEFPELGTTGTTIGTSSSAETWHGEEYATAGFFLKANPKGSPEEFSRLKRMPSGTILPDLDITIHRYASSGDAQKDLEKSLRGRQQPPQSKGLYKGAVLYKSVEGDIRVICQSGQYDIEIGASSKGASPLVMKVLDVVLAELNSTSSKPK